MLDNMNIYAIFYDTFFLSALFILCKDKLDTRVHQHLINIKRKNKFFSA